METVTVTLAGKLGIFSKSKKLADKPGRIALFAAPDGFRDLLGDLPETVSVTTRIGPQTDLAICFIRTRAELTATIDLLKLRLPANASFWIAYPKRTAHQLAEVDQNHVRNALLAAGFVDYKICSIDTSWSALKFTRRKQKS